MGINKKLDDIFNDEAADELFGDVKAKRKSTKSTSQVERNFLRVVEFYRTNQRAPVRGTDDPKEEEVACMLAGIRKKSQWVAQVTHLDEYGLLTMHIDDNATMGSSAGDEPVGSPVHTPEPVTEVSHDSEPAPESMPELPAKEKLQLLGRNLKQQAASLVDISKVFSEFDVDDSDSADRLDRNLIDMEDAVSAIGNSFSEFRSSIADISGLIEKRKEEEAASKITCADDVFNDDDFDAIFDEGDIADDLLGGERAVKSHERSLIDQMSREPCDTFDKYRKRFEAYQQQLKDGALVVSNQKGTNFNEGDLFLWAGLIALLSGQSTDEDVSEHSGKRLHVVFSNGTEAWLREGSISRSMYAYHNRGSKVLCRRLAHVTEDLLSSDDRDEAPDEKEVTGYIYVAKTLSKEPGLNRVKDHILKIGVTKNPIHLRLANAERDPTFLSAPVDLVASYTLQNLEPQKVETLLHAFFGEARLKISAKDRFGKDVVANEWFMVSREVVSEAVSKLMDGSLTGSFYDKNKGVIKDA